MNKKLITLALAFIIGLAIAAPSYLYAGNLPETPINQILSYRSGLDLTDTQAKQLTLVNNNIINKMLQVRAQASNHKNQVDNASGDWSKLDNPQVKGAVKEYFKCQADMKNLELEAMAQASKILSPDQVKKFSELVSIELIMIDMEQEMASAY